MIGYDELCEALERFKRRQANQAELDHLNSGAGPAQRDTGSETFSLKPKKGEEDFSSAPPEDTHEIDVDDVDVIK